MPIFFSDLNEQREYERKKKLRTAIYWTAASAIIIHSIIHLFF